MTQFNETELTAAVVESFDKTPNPRAKFLLQELVKSLHDYVSKTGLTFEEWEYAIDFLTRTGHKCTDTRQEFILLSDVLGVSMLVDAVNHRDREGATQTTVLGPFYVGEHKVTAHGTDISPNNQTGERMFVQSRVTDLKASRWRAFPSTSGMPTTTASTIHRSRTMTRSAPRRGRVSSRTATAASSSAPFCRAATRSRPMAPSAR
ncbi:hypothetical protein ACVME8_001242 [Bradyrhizobium diazoefficiens]